MDWVGRNGEETGHIHLSLRYSNDMHFALRTDDLEAMVLYLSAYGYRKGAASDDPKYMSVKRAGRAGFDQLFLTDPDDNIIEINNAPA